MKKILVRFLMLIPWYKDYIGFYKSVINKVPISRYLEYMLFSSQGGVKGIYWPVHKNSEVTHPYNIFVGINSNPGTRPGCYIQGNGGIYIGNYVQFASNVGIISANHDIYDQRKHTKNKVIIGDYSWIGQGVIILPGVELGPRTIVGAGSVVTKSFSEGYCIIAGNPAKVIKNINKDEVIYPIAASEYYGFVPKEKFERTIRYQNENSNSK